MIFFRIASELGTVLLLQATPIASQYSLIISSFTTASSPFKPAEELGGQINSTITAMVYTMSTKKAHELKLGEGGGAGGELRQKRTIRHGG